MCIRDRQDSDVEQNSESPSQFGLKSATRLHEAGIDVYKRQALGDIIKGAMTSGMRYFSGYLENNDVVRVTGYLVKKSELAKLDQHKQSLNNVSIFGQGARDKGNALDRRVEKREQ